MSRTDYHLALGGELRAFFSHRETNGSCEVEQHETIGGRTVRFKVRQDFYPNQSTAVAHYWNGKEWVDLTSVPWWFPAGSGDGRWWPQETGLTEPLEHEEDRITLGAQTALAELVVRAHALLAPIVA